jgi:peptidyl-prolyl cis-trans isomerase D
MPIMTRMRDSMPLILFGLLIAFLITIVFEWGMDYLGMRGGQSDSVGSINGHKVTYKEFSEVVKTLTDNAKAQTGREVDEAQMPQYRNQAWTSLVNDRLINDEIKRLGIGVSDQELTDWVYGDNPPQELARYFVDSTGRFDRQRYEEVLHNPNQAIQDPKGQDPNFGVKQMKSFEEQLRARRIQEKLMSVVTASVRVTDGELWARYRDEREHLEASYVFFDPAVLVKDADVQVSDADLHSYFDENLDQFKFEASRKMKYVLLSESPTASDTASRKAEIEDAAAKARTGGDFLSLVPMYMDKPDSGSFFHRGELSESLEKAVFAASVGDLVGPVQDQAGFHLVKVLDQRNGPTEYLHAAHILLSLNTPDSNAVKEKARVILAAAKSGKDFAELARENSSDPGAARNGGDLGWFTKGRMVPAFEKAAFGAGNGQIVGPVRTQFGLHIIKVYGRDARELKLAQIALSIAASDQTKNDIADRAKDFAYNARETDLIREAEQLGMEVRETSIQGKAGALSGIGVNEDIAKWAFESKVGAISEPYHLQNGWAVLTVTETKDAGVRPFDEVKESLRPAVLRKKKLEKAKEIAAAARATLASGDSLSAVVRTNPSLSVQTTGGFSPGGVVPGVGRDAAFLGTAMALQVGQISPAIVGNRGAFLIQLLQKTEPDSAQFVSQKESLRSRFLQEKKNRFVSDWLAELKEKADIEDHRDKFFR